MIFQGYLLALAYGVLCILLAGVVFKLGAKKSITRKIVHILVGFEWAILYIFHGAGWHFFAVCVIFTLLLLVEYRMRILPMMSSDGDNAPGTVYYGISMSIMALVCVFVPQCIYPFGIAVFCTSLGDGFAGVIGAAFKKYNPKVYNNKTLLGAVANLVVSFFVALAFSLIFELHIPPIYLISIAVLALGLELLGERGLDNLLLPLGIFAFSSFAILMPEKCIHYVAPIILTPLVIIFAKSKEVLTNSGIIAALALDLVITLALGNFGFLLLLSFLLFSALVDKIKKRKMKFKDDVSEKSAKRDEIQVLSNGIVSMFMAIFFLIDANGIFVCAFVCALAEAFADTCGSGFGVFSRKTYNIINFKPIKSGLSGGVSVIGTLASLVAAFAFSALALAFGMIGAFEFVIISVIAFVASLLDSLLGALLQAKFECQNCGELTEKRIHCDAPTKKKSGVMLVTNDVVNLFSTLLASLFAIVFFLLI